MNESDCTLYRIDDTNLCEVHGCYLRGTLKHQGESGGRKNDGRPAGPFWTPDYWWKFCKNTMALARQGCGIGEEIKREIERITDEKRRSGHFEE
jgi:hypothetical protein